MMEVVLLVLLDTREVNTDDAKSRGKTRSEFVRWVEIPCRRYDRYCQSESNHVKNDSND